MGTNAYRVEYACDGECEYGGCGRKSVFYLLWHRGSDTGAIFHSSHIDRPLYPRDNKIENEVPSMTGNAVAALRRLLDMNDEDMGVSQEEYEVLKKW